MNYIKPYNFYDKLKAKNKKYVTNKTYFDMIISCVSSSFIYEYNADEIDIDSRQIEMMLITGGTIAFYLDKGKLKCGFADFCGKINDNGTPSKVCISLLSGKSKLINADECVLAYNNMTGSPDSILGWYASEFTNIDLSETKIINKSRKSEIYACKDDYSKDQLTTFLKNNDIAADTILKDDSISLDNKDLVRKIELNNINDIANIKYLAQHHNDLLRRIFTFYGCPMGEGFKLAQQSVDEVTSNEMASRVYQLQRYNERVKFCKAITDKFKIDISVALNPIIKNITEVVNNENNEKLDTVEESID